MSNLRFLLARSLASGIVCGGERPEFVDTSREENRGVAKAGKFSGWTKKKKAEGDAGGETKVKSDGEENRTAEDIQLGYEELFQ